jgi:hypothetical protein
VSCARHYLPPTNRVGSAVTPIVEEDLSPIIGLDDALEVGQEGAFAATGLHFRYWETPTSTLTLMYRMDLGRLVGWIKLSLRYLLPLSLFTGFMLFASHDWLAVFGLVTLADSKGC